MARTTSPAQKPKAARKAAQQSTALTFKQKLNRGDVKYSPYIYVAPFFILFALVGLFPLVYTFVVSLHDWNLLTGQGEFVGLDNFRTELADPFFWNSLFNTVSIFLLSAVPQLIAAVVIAAILDQNIRGKTFWRMSVLVPYVVTPVAVALIFSSAFDEKYGLINNMLGAFSIDPVLWKSSVFPSHVAVAAMVSWRWTGYNTLILLAAMQAVPRDIHESASLDGAGAVRRFFSITLPGIRPTMIFVIVTATVGSLQIFTEPKLFNATSATPGGAQREYQTTVLYLWDLAFNRQSFGKASAVAWLLFLIIVIFGVVNFMISRRIASGDVTTSRRKDARRRAKFEATESAAGARTLRGGAIPPEATTVGAADTDPERDMENK